MKQMISRYTQLFLAALLVSVFSPSAVAQGKESSTEIDQIKSEISSKTISLDLKDTPFREVINLIRQRVSFNIIIDDSVEKMFSGGAAAGGNAGGAGAGGLGGGNNSGNNPGGGFGNSNDNSGGGFGSSSGSSSGSGFGSSDNNSSDGFGNSSGSNSDGGFGSSGGDNSSSGFGSSGGSSSSDGFGSSDGGFGSSGGNNSSSGFGRSGDNSSGGLSGGSSRTKPVDKNVTISLDNISIERALKIILGMKNLTAIFKNGVVHIVPETKAKKFDIRFYDVRDVQYELKDFRGPALQFAGGDTQSTVGGGSGGGGESKILGTGLYKDESSSKDIINDEKEFIKLIKGNVGKPQDWEDKNASIRMTSGILVVNQTPEIHKQISFLVNRLRQFK